MLRKLVCAVLAGLCVLLIVEQCLFAEGGGRRPGRGAALREGGGKKGERFHNLPEWKRRAIRRVLAWKRTEIRKVLANDELSRLATRRRIRRICKAARRRIRRILRAGHHHQGGDCAGAGE